MDVKLRSLICLGLNEQVLHLWLEVLASNEDVVKKYYSQNSFINSPGWVQIKCELRLLSRFAQYQQDWYVLFLWRKKNKTETCKHHGQCVLFMLSKSASNRFSFNLNPDWELAGLASAGQKSGAPVQQQPTRISQLHNTASLASLGTRCGQWLNFHSFFFHLL